DKLILPGFGGGDRMRFPKGGELLDCLRFPPIDKDEMCRSWKELYSRHSIPTRIGLELLGLDDGPDGLFQARLWDHRERRPETLAARAVALAVGRGVPRRFDIPGDCEGIAYRLADPARYVGAPALVVGGGTSAAEAVIAISQAKAEVGDATDVYWSYRGDKMPRVSKALAEVFFEAYVGNGNIRYFPHSEPAAVVTAGDRREYLAVRVDRRRMDGRPAETSHLEFPKESCIACIGEEIPEALLDGLGIPRIQTQGKRRIVVTPWLESRRRNLFLCGDLLCPAYLVTEDLDADAEGLEEVKHRGNIKSALRDGVRVAEAVRQRLDGREVIEVRLEDADEVTAEGEAPLPAPAEPPPDDDTPDSAWLVRILPGGVEEQEIELRRQGVTTIGSGDCDVSFPDDSTLAPAHASIVETDEGHLLRDDGGAGGVFLRLRPAEKRALDEGDLLRVGRQFLVVRRHGEGWALSHHDASGRERRRHPLGEKSAVLGRGAADVVLDPDDATLSRRHLAVSLDDGRPVARDLKSVNGTYLRVRGAAALSHGARFRLGQQQFAFLLRPDAVVDRDEPAAPVPPTPSAAAPAVVAPDGASVRFADREGAVALAPGQTVCEAAEAAGVPINAECHSGICGSDPVRILSGAEHAAEPPGDQESETLRDLCGVEPGECRLACMLRAKGPLVVEIL
ncbi:MAG: FHA domain-containing protein, partial [Thermoanaerobaculia bacterium]|nr:FHA domain-containing protein [Thermoanaerobaculia bacterium]